MYDSEAPPESTPSPVKYFRGICNINRVKLEGSAAAVDAVKQRTVREELSIEEFGQVLIDAKESKATPNQVPV